MNSRSFAVVCPTCQAPVGQKCFECFGARTAVLYRPHKARAVAYLESLKSIEPGAGRPKVIDGRTAGKDHAVVTLKGGRADTYRKEPCLNCPWRVDATGEFPAEAFKLSASTAYDASWHTFACHESGREKPAICAGFLLRNSRDNLAVRVHRSKGEIDLDAVSDGGHNLHGSYREMAVANGVDPNDPVLQPCRP